MRELASQQSVGIFRQLASAPGGTGVKTVIENHDAWVHNDEVQREITAALRLQAQARPRDPATNARIAANRRALAGLVTRLPACATQAG